MKRVHTWRPPRWVRLWALCATRAGDGWLWGIIGLILLIFGGPTRFVAIGAATVAGALSVGLFLRLKKITGRKRPCEIEPHCWAKLLPPDQFSFPSGHSMTAFAVAVSLGMFYPPLLSFLLFCAFSIAISRVLLGMHFLSDVAAGSMIGAVLGFTIGDIAVSYLEASLGTLARL